MKIKLPSQSWLQYRVYLRLFLGVLLAIVIANTVKDIFSSLKRENSLFTSLQVTNKPNNITQFDSQAEAIKVGVMVIREVDKARKKWQPTMNYLSQQIPGYSFELVPLRFSNIEELIANQEVDFVLVNPGMYVELEWIYGVRRIATLKNLRLGKPYTQFGGVIFRHRDRPDIQELKDLKGKRFMAVSQIAFGGWQMAQETLRKSGIEAESYFKELKFGGSHDAVVYAVQNGKVDAGTVRTDTLERMAEEGKINLDDFVVLNSQPQGEKFPFALSTNLYPEWPFAMMSHTEPEFAEKITVALINMQSDTPAAVSGKYEGWTIPANYQPVHDTLRNLRIRPYENWGKVTWRQAIHTYRYWLGFACLAIFMFTYGAVYLIQRRRNEAALLQTQSELKLKVTELAQAKKKADFANQAKSDFLSSMSHELRTPLNGILGYAQILRRDRSLTVHQSKGLRIIHESGNHLLTLISDILDLAKIEARKLELIKSDIHLRSFLSGVEGIIRMRAAEKDISFQLQIPTTLPTGIIADEKRLRQVLLNLLGNAVKFTDRGQVILSISVVREALAYKEQDNSRFLNLQTFRFEVRDTGIGIEPQQLQQVFQAFEQVGEQQRRQEGTGLGLAISRQLVELMGGKLQVQSELGKGSTFWFEVVLPIVKIDSDSQAFWQQPQIVGYEGVRKQILVVDDKEENRLVLQHMLEPLGFTIALAEDGQQGIDLFKQLQPDCVLTDLVMPVKTGFEAVQEIRNLPQIHKVPIIAVSASVLEDSAKSCIAGFDYFLLKPVDESELLATLQKYMRLTWIYQTADRPQPKAKVIAELHTSQAFVFPSAQDMRTLYELAMLGDMNQIYEWACSLEELNAQYEPLTQQLKQLSQSFQEKAIVDLVEEHLS